MNRTAAAVTAACLLATLALGGCASSAPAARVRSFDGSVPAYISMGSGDSLGNVMVSNRIFISKRDGESNVYATVGEPLDAE